MKLCVGMVTYGQLKYTRMAVKYLFLNTNIDFDFIAVVGKPGDKGTEDYLKDKANKLFIHKDNYGFPYSLNDIYEYAFIDKDYDACIIIGNDVLVYPNAIDYLLEYSNEYDYVSSQEISIDAIKKLLPKVRKFFGYNKKFIRQDFPEFMEYKPPITNKTYDLTKYKIIGDTHNLTLFTRRWFETVGYVDVNFYPAYFEDNDYARRGQLLRMKMLQIQKAKYFHFWSRTIMEDSKKKSENDFYFPLNKKYYIKKWGGEPGEEKYTVPYNGNHYVIAGIMLPPSLKIGSRDGEEKMLSYWKSLDK